MCLELMRSDMGCTAGGTIKSGIDDAEKKVSSKLSELNLKLEQEEILAK